MFFQKKRSATFRAADLVRFKIDKSRQLSIWRTNPHSLMTVAGLLTRRPSNTPPTGWSLRQFPLSLAGSTECRFFPEGTYEFCASRLRYIVMLARHFTIVKRIIRLNVENCRSFLHGFCTISCQFRIDGTGRSFYDISIMNFKRES